MIDYIGIARKAVECDDMIKLLEGKGEYRCEFYYYGFPPDADVTDWNNLISRGIYALYNEGGYDCIPDMIIEAIKEMCEGDVEEVYCAFRFFFNSVMKEKGNFEPVPFHISEQIKPVVMQAVFNNKEKLSKCFDWEGWRHSDGMWGAIKRWVKILQEDYETCSEYDMEEAE